MKKKLAILLATMALMMAAVGGPASADHLERDRDEHFLGYYPVYGVVDDVNFVNVRERNWRDGRCFVEDIDSDGYIAEYDYTCYY